MRAVTWGSWVLSSRPELALHVNRFQPRSILQAVIEVKRWNENKFLFVRGTFFSSCVFLTWL